MGRVKFGEMTPSEIWEFVVFVGAIFSVGAILGGPPVGTIGESFLQHIPIAFLITASQASRPQWASGLAGVRSHVAPVNQKCGCADCSL
jgi:hypothetical protein